jgi:hypothetical protein
VKRSGQDAGLHYAAATLRIEKKQAVKEFDFVGRADAAVEVVKIGAAAERDVLAIVHVFAIRQNVGSGPAAEEGPLLKESNAPAGFSQRDAGRQSRQPAADHDHVFRGHFPLSGARIERGR